MHAKRGYTVTQVPMFNNCTQESKIPTEMNNDEVK